MLKFAQNWSIIHTTGGCEAPPPYKEYCRER